MLTLVITWLVTALSLFIIARLNIGIEMKDFSSALIAAVVIGIVNAVLQPLLTVLTLPLSILTLGLFSFVINAALFWLAAQLVSGFSLRNGFISALIGSVLLSVLNGVILAVLRGLGIA